MRGWLIIDYGGVLADDHVAGAEFELSQSLCAQASAIRSALSESSSNGRSLRLDELSESAFWSAVACEVCPKGLSPPPAQELTRLWASCYAIRTDVVDVLREAQSWGFGVGIATNVDRYREQYLLAEMRKHSLTATVWSSYKIGFLKPSVEYFLQIEGELSRKEGRPPCLYVDDRQTHVDAASSVGWIALRATQAEAIRAWLKQQNVAKWEI